MHHFAGANTRTMRAKRTQPVQRYDFDVSDSEEEDDDREALPPQRGGSASRLRSVGGAAANEALAAPRDAASVVSDIKQAVSLSLRQSSAREMERMDEVTKEKDGRRDGEGREAFVSSIDRFFSLFFS